LGIGDQQAGRGDHGTTFTQSTFGQEPSAVSTLWKVFACIAIFFSFFKAFSWWQGHEGGFAGLELRSWNHQAPRAAPQAPPDQRPVGRDPKPQRADTQPANQERPRASSVTKCVGRSGTVYSDSPCPAGATATTVDTPSDLNVSEGLAKGRVQPERQAPSTAYNPAPRDVDVAKNAVKAACEALTAESHKWDAFARQPLSGHTQDEVRARQREIRARKFELRC
jgi:hypothetical protein